MRYRRRPFAFLLVAACGGHTDATRVSQTSSASPEQLRNGVLVAFDPSECFACGSSVARVAIALHRCHTDTRFVLKRAPTHAEHDALRVARIEATLQPPDTARRTPSTRAPDLWVIRQGVATDSAIGARAVQRFAVGLDSTCAMRVADTATGKLQAQTPASLTRKTGGML